MWRSLWIISRDAVNEWMADNAFQWAAAISFYTIISLAPLVTFTLAAASLFYGEQALRGEILSQISSLVGRPGALVVQDILANAQQSRAGFIGVLSAFMLLFGASAAVLQLKEALNGVWNITPRTDLTWKDTVKTRALSMLVVLGIGALLLILTIGRAVFQAMAAALPLMNPIWGWLAYPLGLAFTTGLFVAIFRFLPDVRIPWKNALVGGAVTSVLFEIGRLGLAVYLTRAAPGSAYGASGALIAFLLWIYYSSAILLLGAEFAQVCSRQLQWPARDPKKSNPSGRNPAMPW